MSEFGAGVVFGAAGMILFLVIYFSSTSGPSLSEQTDELRKRVERLEQDFNPGRK